MKKAIKKALFTIFTCLTIFNYTSQAPDNSDTKSEVTQNSNANSSSGTVILTPKAKLISITPDAEKIMAYVARVSNPANQANEKIAGLLKFCIKNGHWSVFEQAFMTIEVETSRAICTQILRHRSFSFQQFSQRYADNSLLCEEIPLPDIRLQDYKNRQNSIDNLSEDEKAYWHAKIKDVFKQSMDLYLQMIAAGVAKECARFVLPEQMPARIYMSGTIRSWIHYIELRSGNGTQKEHMEVAELCRQIFIEQLPVVAKALGWTDIEETKITENIPTIQETLSSQ